MADTLPTIWPAELHTLAKHAILRRYLDAWFPILASQASSLARQHGNARTREILFIDGFAGPGEYANNHDGSPIIALKSVLQHSRNFSMPIRMLFIEDQIQRFQNLQKVLDRYTNQISQSGNISGVYPHTGDCDSVLNNLLSQYEKNNITFGPALAFLDQFGYGAVSMALVSRILRFSECEVFTYLDYKDMNRWITDPTKAATFTRAYGGQEWQDAIKLPEHKRREFLHDKYIQALKDPKRGNAKYVVSFSMFNDTGLLLYWLIFCTNNLRGLEEMKRAMWSVDKDGTFRFSDKDTPNQAGLFNQVYDQDWLADELSARLVGRTMTASQIKEYVLTDTPCWQFKQALKSLEDSDKISICKQPPGRRAGSYPNEQLDDIQIQFQLSLFS